VLAWSSRCSAHRRDHDGDVLDRVPLSLFARSEISMLGTSIPLVMDLAKTSGFNPLQLGLIWTFRAAASCCYQSGVLIVAIRMAFDARDLLRMGALLTVIEFLILLLLVALWWL